VVVLDYGGEYLRVVFLLHYLLWWQVVGLGIVVVILV
jgi:hypothetical protein